MNVFSYIRVSGLGQADKDGPERQRIAIKDFCAKHKLDDLNEFSESISGTIEAMDRPAFADLIIKANIFNQSPHDTLHIRGIVVENMDRLARDVMVSELLFRECRKFGIQVFCANTGELVDVATNEGDPTRKMMRQILGAIAEWEKTMIVRKLGSARKRHRLNAGRCEGRKPYGFTPEERNIIALIKSMRTANDIVPAMTWDMIAFELNRRGFKTRENKKWTRGHVYSIHTKRRQKK